MHREVLMLIFFFFLKPGLNFTFSYRVIIGHYCFYYPVASLGREGWAGPQWHCQSKSSVAVCSPGGHRKQVAVLIVLAPNSCPSSRQFRSGREVSGLLCPPRFTSSCVHNNSRYVPGEGNCVGIYTVLPKLCGYLVGRAECLCCRECLGLQLESNRIIKNYTK